MEDRKARAVSNRGGIKMISFFPSRRTGRLIACEGMLELDFMRIVDQWDVDDIQEQPVKVEYTFIGRTNKVLLGHYPNEIGEDVAHLHCYPDFLIKFRRGRPPLLVEVKADRYVRDPEVKLKAVACDLYARSQGWDFRLFKESDIRTSELARARLIRRYERTAVPSEIRSKVMDVLSQNDSPVSCSVLARKLDGEYRVNLAYVFALVAQQAITIAGGDGTFSPDTLITPEG